MMFPETDSSVPPVEKLTAAYGPVAAIYDALMAGVPHNLWLHRIEQEVVKRGRYPRATLDIACGTGIVTELLFERGYTPLIGVDLSPEMVRIARTKADARGLSGKIDYQVQDASTLDLRESRFDLAVSLFDSLNYITEPNKLASAFLRIATHLSPGGIFAFDVNSLYALSHNLFTQRTDTGPLRHNWQSYWDRETRTCRVEMAFEIEDEVTGELRRFHETHVQRAYTITELRDFLEQAGFIKIEVFGNYGDRPPGPKSDRLLFIAEKP